MDSTFEQQEQIKNFLQIELLKRGFTSKIVKFEEIEAAMNRFEFETEEFQTTPVIFKSIKISNFSSKILRDSSGVLRFYIDVNAFFSNFSGGTNGTTLFTLNGILGENDDNKHVYDMHVD